MRQHGNLLLAVLLPHVAVDRDSSGIVDRVHIMVDISDDTNVVRRRVELTRVVRRRHWSGEEKGRIVAEAIAPGAVVPDVARRHDLVPQHLSNWIKEGSFALPADAVPSFVPVVVKTARANEAARQHRAVIIEVVIGAIKVRVPDGAEVK